MINTNRELLHHVHRLGVEWGQIMVEMAEDCEWEEEKGGDGGEEEQEEGRGWSKKIMILDIGF